MQNINPQVIRFGLIGLGATLLVYALNIAENTNSDFSSSTIIDEQDQKPSAYLTESTFNIFSTEGKLSKLYVEKAFFYSNKDSIRIEAPRFTSSESASRVQLTAETGFYNPTEETLSLEGSVLAKQIDQDGPLWELSSNKLNVDYRSGTLSTLEEVHISNGIHSLKATGFLGSFNKKEIKLFSKVRGKYVY